MATATLPAEHLTRPEAARLLRVGLRTLDRAIAAGTVPAIRVGKCVRLPRHALLIGVMTTAPAADRHDHPRPAA